MPENERLVPLAEFEALLDWWLSAPRDRHGEPIWCRHRCLNRCRDCEAARR